MCGTCVRLRCTPSIWGDGEARLSLSGRHPGDSYPVRPPPSIWGERFLACFAYTSQQLISTAYPYFSLCLFTVSPQDGVTANGESFFHMYRVQLILLHHVRWTLQSLELNLRFGTPTALGLATSPRNNRAVVCRVRSRLSAIVSGSHHQLEGAAPPQGDRRTSPAMGRCACAKHTDQQGEKTRHPRSTCVSN